MALTNKQIIELLTSNAAMTDAELVRAMEVNGISPAQMASAVGLTTGEVAARVAATIPPGQSITLGDTFIQPKYQITGSGETEQIGGIENVYTYKVSDNRVGGKFQEYDAQGNFLSTGTQKKVDAVKDFLKFAAGSAALFGGLGGNTLFGGSSGGSLAADADIAGGLVPEYGTSTAYDTFMSSAMTPEALASLEATVAASPEIIGSGALLTDAAAGITTNGLLSTAGTAAGAAAGTAAGSAAGSAAGTAAGTALTTAQVADLAKTGLTAAQIANLVSTGGTTAAGLLQQQTSREAAVKAQQMIDAETAAAKQAATFRPIGMTTRFGTSNFGFDPVTGQLTSAGYTLSPEAKNAQDRLVKLAESGLQQAEGAEALFSPLKTGAQSLFTLGQGYLAKSPEQVASDYLKSQMSLLQPGREMELANLQNKLYQQGRSGVAVAQGGTYGDTTPELQALFNARARQEAELAAGAQKAGQADVLFGAGLLGTGAQTLGNYYGGQVAAYQPYKTALGEVQNLETLAQQPLTMGIGLGEKSAQAGYNVGRLGLMGAGQSVALATGADATRNPAASAIGGLTSNPLFTNAIAKLAGGTPVNALDFGAYGTGDAGFQKMLEEVYG